MTHRGEAKAVARANIALAKYWGKAGIEKNVPAVPSISVTLDPLRTETVVRFDPALDADVLVLGGDVADAKATARASKLLSRIRERAGLRTYARVESHNTFPTASGLASSASGFAALAGAACAAAGLDVDASELSALARGASASAARSVFGGFVELPSGAPDDDALAAVALHPPDFWDVRVVVAVTAEHAKETGSTDGMERTRETSPHYAAWLDFAPRVCATVRAALAVRDLHAVGTAMEQSTLAMHACALADAPGILYWSDATLSAFAHVKALRARGLAAYATMDAGPHVKVLCAASDAPAVERELAGARGVLRTLVARPGPGLEVTR